MDTIFDFGTFFRTVRIAKGLALMTFCRENNLNVVLVSNIERGNAVPSKEEVNSYIKALQLKRGTKDYKKFKELYNKYNAEKVSDEKVPLYVDIPKDKLDQVMKILSR